MSELRNSQMIERQSDAAIQVHIDRLAKYFYLSCMGLLALRFLSSTLFSQLSQPILISPGIDNTYWLIHWLGIPRLATYSFLWSAVLDMLLFLLPLIASLVPGRRVYAFLFTVLLFIYQVTYSTYAIHHYHSLIGMMILSVPFWCRGERFMLLWQAARYYFFFIFSSAALWKLCSGSLLEPGQMSAILMSQHTQYIFDYPGSSLSQFYSWLIAHQKFSQALLYAGFLLQLSFIGGFFTRRYDRIYLILFILFFAMNYLVMHILSLELFVFCLVLLPERITHLEKQQARNIYLNCSKFLSSRSLFRPTFLSGFSS